MAITKPPVLPAWADAGDKVQPSNAELSVGWPVSSTPPSRQRFNWVLNFVANAVRYFSRRGMPDYDAAETYMTGDRVIGDDGKTYKCLVDNTTGFAPSTNPAKWARWGFTLAELDAESTTPAQFDNSVKRASTAFVQRALGSYSGLYSISSNMALDASHVGKIGVPSAAYTITLPPVSSVTPGATVTIFNYQAASSTVQRAGTDTIAAGNGVSLTSVALPSGYTTFVAETTGIWEMTGTAALKYSTLFGNSFASNGYQKFPSGLMIQWGVYNQPAAGAQTQNFTFAFPTACLQVFTSQDYQNPGSSVVGASPLNATQFTSNTGAGDGFYVFAIGY